MYFIFNEIFINVSAPEFLMTEVEEDQQKSTTYSTYFFFEALLLFCRQKTKSTPAQGM